MSIRTYFDNNLFHSAHDWSEQDKALIQGPFLSGKNSLYLSIELFAELFGILLNVDKQSRLQSRAALLLHMMNSGRVFNYSGTIIRNELLQRPRDLFVDVNRKEILRMFLREIAGGKIPSAIPPFLAYIRNLKESDRTQWQDIVNSLRQYNQDKHGRLSPKDCSFEQFYVGFPEELFAGWLKKAALEGQQVSFPCEDVLKNSSQYKYANAIARSVAAWTYLNVFVYKGRHIKLSDTFDIQQLVYLVDVDLLVSGDRNLTEACMLVYGKKIQVVTPEVFFDELRRSHSSAVHPSTSSTVSEPTESVALRQVQGERK